MFGKTVRRKPKGVEVDLNRVVTPMLDMTFQILFLLIINFRIPSAEGQIDLFLPKEEEGNPINAPEDELDKKDTDEYRIRLFVYRGEGENQGAIAGITFRPKANKDAENVEPDGVNTRDLMAALREKLKPIQPKEGAAKQPTLKIESDNKLRYSELLRVMDVLREMKFTNVGVMPIPKDPSPK